MNVLGILLLAVALQESPIDPWRQKLRIRPLVPDLAAHAIHSYYVAAPESPDGGRVLYYQSTTPEGHEGEIRVLDRSSGKSRAVASKITVEDAHRAACQQWIRGGKSVVFHDFRDGEWVVAIVDAETLEERVLARGRQLGWGPPGGRVVPLYGPHARPEGHRDLELLDVESGEIRTVCTAETVTKAYSDWIAKQFGGRPISIFFPVLGPDGARVFFKLAAARESAIDPKSPDLFRRKTASDRAGLLVFDLKSARLTFPEPRSWGHPAWLPDGRRILDVGHLLIDADSGVAKKIPGLPELKGGPHPSACPDGRIFVTDFTPPLGEPKPKGFWSMLVGDLNGDRSVVLHTFDLTGGAKSWRGSHPHPVFSPDGRRIYFNATIGGWTQLCVAELTGDR
jgi:WD40 repeat protein